MMLEGAGFEVIDIGINNAVEKYLARSTEHQPDILGMSALLTTTMPYMKVVIDTLKEKNLRDNTSCWSVAPRSTRNSGRRLARTPTAATRRSR
jgi:methanogenic corrinoid protein MtbC1